MKPRNTGDLATFWCCSDWLERRRFGEWMCILCRYRSGAGSWGTTTSCISTFKELCLLFLAGVFWGQCFKVHFIFYSQMLMCLNEWCSAVAINKQVSIWGFSRWKACWWEPGLIMALQVLSEVCRTKQRNQACHLLQELSDLGDGACCVQHEIAK